MAQTSRSDVELVEAARDARDLAAFAELVNRYQHAAFAVAVSVAGDRALAEDATQETFLHAWASLDRLRDPARVAPWLCGISRNVARGLVRDRAREVPEDTDDEPASDASPLRQLMERDADRALSELLGRVPNRYRAPMVLHYAAEQSVSQIAQCLELSESNVKKLLSRGRELLRERAQRFTELTSACRVPATLAVAIVAAAGARSAAAHTATAGAITTLATTGVVVKKIIIIAAAIVAVVVSVLGDRLLGDSEDHARAASAGSTKIAPANVEATRPARASRHQLTGVVLDDRTDAPLAGATVLVRRAAGGDLATAIDEEQRPPAIVVTDAAGRFSFELASGRFYVEANLRGYTSAKPAEVVIGTAGVERELRLIRGGVRVHGAVTDFQGGPVVEAVVTAAAAPGGVPTGAAKAAVTGADGRYELWLVAGTYELEAVHPAYAPAEAELTVTEAEVARDLHLVPTSIIEGVVLDRRDATPVAGAIVHVDGQAEPAAVADDGGRFRIARIPAGTFALAARATHRITLVPTVVELDIGETRTDVELWLDRGADVSGRVVDEDGRAVAGVQAGVVRWTDRLSHQAQAATDEQGRFVIHGVAPGSYGAVADAPARPRLLHRSGVEVGDRDVTDLELVVKSAQVVTGRVVPARLATITLARPKGSVFASLTLGGDLSDLLNLATSTTRTRADGTFEIERAPAGSYAVVAVADDGTRGETQVVVGRDQQLTISLAATPTVRGTIVDDLGRPVASLALRATSDAYYPARVYEAITDTAGGFVLRGFSAGAVELAAVDPTCRRQLAGDATTTITVTEKPAEVRLVASGCERAIRGVVVDAQGTGVADTWIHVEHDGFQAVPIVSDAAGRFAVTGLHAGPYVVTAYHPIHGRGRLEAAAPDTNHRIALRGPASLKVGVRERGRAAVGFELRLRGAMHRAVRSQSADGTVTVGNLTAGRYKLQIHSDRGSATADVELEPGASRTVDVELRPWSVVRGTLLGEDGRPLADHVVTPIHNPADGTPLATDDLLFTAHTATTDRDGRFELRRVDPDTNVLVIASPAGTFSGVVLQVRAGEHRDLGRVTVKLTAAE